MADKTNNGNQVQSMEISVVFMNGTTRTIQGAVSVEYTPSLQGYSINMIGAMLLIPAQNLQFMTVLPSSGTASDQEGSSEPVPVQKDREGSGK